MVFWLIALMAWVFPFMPPVSAEEQARLRIITEWPELAEAVNSTEVHYHERRLLASRGLCNNNNIGINGCYKSDLGVVIIADEARYSVGTLIHELMHAAHHQAMGWAPAPAGWEDHCFFYACENAIEYVAGMASVVLYPTDLCTVQLDGFFCVGASWDEVKPEHIEFFRLWMASEMDRLRDDVD